MRGRATPPSDFDRAARQQRVILSLRQQADFATLARPDVLSQLVKATKGAIKTDFPVAKLPQLIELAQRMDIGNVRSFVFTPPYYGSEGYVNGTYVLQAERGADPAGGRRRLRLRPARAGPAPGDRRGGRGRVGPQQHRRDRAGRRTLAGYLDYEGFAASAPRGRAPGHRACREDHHPGLQRRGDERSRRRSRRLEALFKVTVVPVADPKMRADVVVVQGTRTPVLEAPRPTPDGDARRPASAAGPAGVTPVASGRVDGRHPVRVRRHVAADDVEVAVLDLPRDRARPRRRRPAAGRPR